MKPLKEKYARYVLETITNHKGHEVAYQVLKRSSESYKLDFVKSFTYKQDAIRHVLELNQIIHYMLGMSKPERTKNVCYLLQKTKRKQAA